MNTQQEKVIYEKRFLSDTWGEILIQSCLVQNDRESFYELREVFDFKDFNLGVEDPYIICGEASRKAELIKELVDEYDLKHSEYAASCALKAIEIHMIDPTAVPVL
ncbi:hypothetical protein [Vibrio alginolyticus]|uniref:hypothetical protein n=1 Tax=Vibrio alginolyticus TaxID=663 RepID=UPI003F66A2FB